MPKITRIRAREILDSRGNPTVEAEACSGKKIFAGSAPSGASTGTHEALELRDKDPKRFGGKGVLTAIGNVKKISKALKGKELKSLNQFDSLMIKLDGTKNKSKLGANATTAVSFALLKAIAAVNRQEVYEYLEGKTLPVPLMNIINGGKHAGNNLAIQEFMIAPIGFDSFHDALRGGTEVYHALGRRLEKKYGPSARNVGDEGGFAPDMKTTNEALNEIEAAIDEVGYTGKIKIAIDAAASEFYMPHENRYSIDGVTVETYALLDMYTELIESYPLVSIEDPFHEEDFDTFGILSKRVGSSVQIVGDDLTVTNTDRLRAALDKGSITALLLKVNQIGTISEAVSAVNMCYSHGLNVVVSHRSGETDETIIADLTVGLDTGQIKTGAPARGERVAKYNRLLKIEDMLGENGKYAGENFRHVPRRIIGKI